MGDPIHNKKKTKGPSHPWKRSRIELERALVKEYGLHNKQEVWRAESLLRRITSQAKRLIRDKKIEQAQIETLALLKKLNKLGLVNETTPIEDVLALTIKDVLNRRLQSVVYQNKLAISPKQARQMILHGHISVNGRKNDVPSYLVIEGDVIEYNPKSQFNDVEHIEVVKRINKEKGIKEVKNIKEEVKKEEGLIIPIEDTKDE